MIVWIVVVAAALCLIAAAWFAPLLWCSGRIMSAGECSAMWGGDPFGFLTQNFWQRLFTGRL